MAQPNIECPLVAMGYIPGDVPDIPVIPPPAGGGDVDPGGPIITTTRTDPANPGGPPIDPDAPPPPPPNQPVIVGTQSAPGTGNIFDPGVLQVQDLQLGSTTTDYIDPVRFNTTTLNVRRPVTIVDTQVPHPILRTERDSLVDNVLVEINTTRKSTFSHMNDMTLDKVKQSLKPEVTAIIDNLHVEGFRQSDTLIVNNLLNKLYQNELSEVVMADINALKSFTLPPVQTKNKTVTIPKKLSYNVSKREVSKSREVVPVTGSTAPKLLSYDEAVYYIQQKRKSLITTDYKNIYIRDLMKFWYKLAADDALTTTPYVLDLQDEIKLIEGLGEDSSCTLEFCSVPSINLESTAAIDTAIDPYYILSLDETDITELDTENFLLRKSRVAYDIVTDTATFETDFKHKVFPYLVAYVHFNDPIITWIQDGRVSIHLEIPSITLRNFGDFSLVRRIPTHIILIPTNRFNLIPRGGKSESVDWGTRTLQLYHSIDNTRRSNSQLLTSPIFKFQQTWPGINIDTIYTTTTRTGISVTLTDGTTDVIPVANYLMTFIDSNGVLGNIPIPGNNLYVTVNGTTYAIPVTSITNIVIVNNLYPYSLEASLVTSPPVSQNNYVPTLDDPTGNTVPTRKSSPLRYFVRVINYLKNNYSYDTALTYYDIYSRMENTYRYGLTSDMAIKTKNYLALGNATNISIYGSTVANPYRVINFLGSGAEAFPILSPVNPAEPPTGAL